jgi:very-short-patch-repair endonuclease
MTSALEILPTRGEVAARRADGGGAVSGTTSDKNKTKANPKQKQSLRRPEVYEARMLRRTMSLPEVLLWREIKGNKLGVGFRKQHPIGAYKADFCYADGKLVIEVDGFAHDTGDVAARDERRDAYMSDKGFTVIRFPARDVLNDIGSVLDRIRLALTPLHHASVVPGLSGGLPPATHQTAPTSGEDLA